MKLEIVVSFVAAMASKFMLDRHRLSTSQATAPVLAEALIIEERDLRYGVRLVCITIFASKFTLI